jgi:hypothetical protein
MSLNRSHQWTYHSSPGDMSIDSHGDDEASWVKLLTRPPVLSDNLTSTDIHEGVRILCINI